MNRAVPDDLSLESIPFPYGPNGDGALIFLDQKGYPVSGGQLFVYQPNTDTPVPTYRDGAGLIRNTNPVILNSQGKAEVFVPHDVTKVDVQVRAHNGDVLATQLGVEMCRIAPPNPSGVIPLEYRCIVLPSSAEVDPAIARARKAGLAIPQDVLERELLAQIVATLVAIGGNAFEDWKDKRLPKTGDQIMIAKYSGVTFRGADGLEYRMINDKDISGIVTSEGVARV